MTTLRQFAVLGLLSLAASAGAASSPSATPEALVSIAAKVGSQIVTNVEVEQAIKALEASMSVAELASAEGKKKLSDARKKVLDRMVQEKLVILAAEKGPEGYKEAVDRGTAPANPYLPSSIEVEEELDKAYDEARNRYGSQSEFEAQLKAERLSVSEFRSHLRERLREQMTFDRMLMSKKKEFQPSLRVSEEEALAFYQEHKASFAVGSQVNLRHILYKPSETAKAEAAVASLKGLSGPRLRDAFANLAKKDSKDDLSAGKGGRLGWIEKGGLRWSEVESRAFSLKPGELAGPIRSADGLHVILVEEQKAGEQKNYDEVKAQVRNLVYGGKVNKRIEDWIEELKREFYVERNDS
ncbi:MAG: peptidyl-prolyl cis-trans isomerase [candidate division FCPU426 bacterium]